VDLVDDGAAGGLVQAVDVLRDHGDPGAFLQFGNGQMARIAVGIALVGSG
jgi:hypothetical protein